MRLGIGNKVGDDGSNDVGKELELEENLRGRLGTNTGADGLGKETPPMFRSAYWFWDAKTNREGAWIKFEYDRG